MQNIGRGMKEALCRLYVKDNNNQIVKILTSRAEIEQVIIEYNKQHFQKVHNTEVYQDKIYNKLYEDQTQNKILNSTLEHSNCNSKNVYEFLKLLT